MLSARPLTVGRCSELHISVLCVNCKIKIGNNNQLNFYNKGLMMKPRDSSTATVVESAGKSRIRFNINIYQFKIYFLASRLWGKFK